MAKSDEPKWKRIAAAVKAGKQVSKQPKKVAKKTSKYR
jgi:hypothetical protein